MAENSAIEWCDATWQILSGCLPKNPACLRCYSARLCGTRLKGRPETRGLTVKTADGRFAFNGKARLNEKRLDWPTRWRGHPEAKKEGRSSRIFVADRSDIGYALEALGEYAVDRVFAVEAEAANHTFINLTKRWAELAAYLLRKRTRRVRDVHPVANWDLEYHWPLPNAWIGWSAHDQESFDAGWAAMKPLADSGWLIWCSLEPMLEPVDVSKAVREGLRWVVVGGESGFNDARGGPRPMHPDWVRAVRDACAAAGVAFFFKQWGIWTPGENVERTKGKVAVASLTSGRWFFQTEDLADEEGHVDDEPDLYRVGKTEAGAHLDGVRHLAWPQARGDA